MCTYGKAYKQELCAYTNQLGVERNNDQLSWVHDGSPYLRETLHRTMTSPALHVYIVIKKWCSFGEYHHHRCTCCCGADQACPKLGNAHEGCCCTCCPPCTTPGRVLGISQRRCGVSSSNKSSSSPSSREGSSHESGTVLCAAAQLGRELLARYCQSLCWCVGVSYTSNPSASSINSMRPLYTSLGKAKLWAAKGPCNEDVRVGCVESMELMWVSDGAGDCSACGGWGVCTVCIVCMCWGLNHDSGSLYVAELVRWTFLWL